MTKLRVSVKYASDLEYSLAGQGIDFIGLAVTMSGRDEPIVRIAFRGRHVDSSTGTIHDREYATIYMASGEAQALAGALLAIAQGGAAQVDVKF
jgi:hypothetical protein